MKITKKQLKRLIREAMPGPSYGRSKPNIDFNNDPREELANQIRMASKDVHGRKDVYDLEGKTIEELEDILYDLANSQEQQAIDDMDREEMEGLKR